MAAWYSVNRSKPEEKQRHAGRTKRGERRVDDVRQPARRLAGLHQDRDRHGVERLVQQDRQKGAKAQKPHPAVRRIDLHAGGQRHSVDQRVNPQSQRHADPTQPIGRMAVRRRWRDRGRDRGRHASCSCGMSPCCARAGSCWWKWKARIRKNIVNRPAIIHQMARSREPRTATACGSICSRPIPSISPPQRLIESCRRVCVSRTMSGSQPPASDAKDDGDAINPGENLGPVRPSARSR